MASFAATAFRPIAYETLDRACNAYRQRCFELPWQYANIGAKQNLMKQMEERSVTLNQPECAVFDEEKQMEDRRITNKLLQYCLNKNRSSVQLPRESDTDLQVVPWNDPSSSYTDTSWDTPNLSEEPFIPSSSDGEHSYLSPPSEGEDSYLSSSSLREKALKSPSRPSVYLSSLICREDPIISSSTCAEDPFILSSSVDLPSTSSRFDLPSTSSRFDLPSTSTIAEDDSYISSLFDSFWPLPEEYYIPVNPVTLMPMDVYVPEESEELSKPMHQESKEMPKPYHPSLDHDYLQISEVVEGPEVKKEIGADEPVVDVWEIDHFNDQVPAPNHTPDYCPVLKRETRRTSARTAEIRLRQQARKFSKAVQAVLNHPKPLSVRQYKNIRPKNSVETTPSQSDIEECYSRPIRPIYTKMSKKKTSKGRIDHSASERHRREVLRKNFHSLSELIPIQFLRGEKASSQISKQKILNGSKSFILDVYSVKSSYKALHNRNSIFRDLLR